MFYQIKKLIFLSIAFSSFFLISSQSTEQQLYQAIKFGLSRIIHTYTEQNIDLKYIDKSDNKTFLQCAITYDNIDAVKILLAHEVNINQQDNFGGTALHTAVSRMEKEPNLEILKLLLTHHTIDTKIQNKLGRTAYACAQFYEHQKAMDLLQEHEVSKKNNFERLSCSSDTTALSSHSSTSGQNNNEALPSQKIKTGHKTHWLTKFFNRDS